MRLFKLDYYSIFLILSAGLQQVYGQQLPLQTYSLAAYSYVPTQADGFQIDWRLDLGPNTMALDRSNTFCFSAGFLQPSVNRFDIEGQWGRYNPSIELTHSASGSMMRLFSKEPDLILLGYTIYNLQGQALMRDPTKYRSSHTGRVIPTQALASGVYLLQVGYLPEFMHFDDKNNYWIKYLKFIKP